MGMSERTLARYFIRKGYVRAANEYLRRTRGRAYKKGYEVRFVLKSVQERNEVRDLLLEVGLKPGNPFEKHSRIVQPVYGRESVRKILSWVARVRRAGSPRNERSRRSIGRTKR